MPWHDVCLKKVAEFAPMPVIGVSSTMIIAKLSLKDIFAASVQVVFGWDFLGIPRKAIDYHHYPPVQIYVQ
jgi:hypothetical protein